MATKKKKIKKYADWEMLWNIWIVANKDKKFKWGSWDCVIFSNSLIKAITGTSVLPTEWKWKSEEEAIKSIAKYGKKKGIAEGIAQAVKKLDGIYEVDPAFVSKADFIVYEDAEGTELVGVHDGMSILAPSSVDGLVTRQGYKILRVWRID